MSCRVHRSSQSLAAQELSKELRVAGAEDGRPLEAAKLSPAKISPDTTAQMLENFSVFDLKPWHTHIFHAQPFRSLNVWTGKKKKKKRSNELRSQIFWA